jgi:hypothetical protein
MLVAAAVLEAGLGICLGCKIYGVCFPKSLNYGRESSREHSEAGDPCDDVRTGAIT